MLKREKILEFEWDRWNFDKSYYKHGITPSEAEEIFLDEDLKVQEDIKHSQKEKRYIAFGKTIRGKVLFVVFTMREKMIRIISARIANKKKRKHYEKT